MSEPEIGSYAIVCDSDGKPTALVGPGDPRPEGCEITIAMACSREDAEKEFRRLKELHAQRNNQPGCHSIGFVFGPMKDRESRILTPEYLITDVYKDGVLVETRKTPTRDLIG